MYDLTRLISFPRPLFGPRRALVRPRLEWLEDRITPTTFTPTVFTDGVNTGTVQTLRDAIIAANNDTGTATDTIQLQAGTYQLTIANTNGKYENSVGKEGDLNITSSKHALVIQGATDASGKPTTIIQQTVIDRVFEIANPDATVTFENVIIEGGNAQNDYFAGHTPGSSDALGGGILDDGGDVTLCNVVLQSNQAKAGNTYDAKGGGIYVFNGGSLTIHSSVIQSNVASGGAGTGNKDGGNAEGGGIYINSTGATTITDSTLSGNTLTGGNADVGFGGQVAGGSIASFGNGPLTITDSILSGNTLNGGNNAGSTSGNNASNGGAAFGGSIYTNTGAVTVTASTLSGNTLTAGNADNAFGSGDGAFGGSIESSGGSLTITDSILSGNTLKGGTNVSGTTNNYFGGFARGGSIESQGAVTITASTLSGNTLTGGTGGGSYEGGVVQGGSIKEFFGPLTITASTLSGNTLTGGNGSTVGGNASGGSVYATGTATVIDSTLSNNTVTGGSASGSSVTPGTAQGGGAYFDVVTDGKLVLVNSTIAGNQAIGGQGASSNPVAAGGGLFLPHGVTGTATATLTNVTVADNKASPAPGTSGNTVGGGIDVDTSGTITLVNTLVALNSASTGPDYNGAVGNSDHNLIGNADGSSGFSAAHGDLLGTTANPLDPHLGPLQNNGGPTLTMALLSGSPAIDAGDNNAQSDTGPHDQRGPDFARVFNGTIDIGAFEVQPPPTPITPTVFTDGVNTGTVQTLRDAILAANKDSSTDTDIIQLQAGTYQLTIANSNGQDNTGTQGDLDITSPSHDLVIQGVTDASSKPATIIDQTVADRVFQIINFRIVNPGATVTFKDLIIEGGKAEDDGTAGAAAGSTGALGGGILDDGDNVRLSNVVLQSNQAQAGPGNFARGGGIYTLDGSLTITNGVIQNNLASGGDGISTSQNGAGGSGGGVYFDSTSAETNLRIAASTVAGNKAVGGNGYPSGNGNGGSAEGGGIDILLALAPTCSDSAVSISASTISGNSALGGNASGTGESGRAHGGGVWLYESDSILVNATIAENNVIAGKGANQVSAGGGIYLINGGTVTLTNVTVADNKASLAQGGSGTTYGGGIFIDSTVSLYNTLVALNSAATGPDYDGTVSNSSHNLIGNADGSNGFSAAHGDLLGTTANPLDPQLGPLANNGGPTRTLALLAGSPAINAGDNTAQSVTGPYDQRGQGVARVVNGTIDIGAFEVQPSPPAPTPPPGGGGVTTATPPSLFQALIALYIDGIELEAFEQASSAAFRGDFATASALGMLLQFFGNPNLDSIEADIAFKEPFAGPFGPYFVLAGQLALLNALQSS